MKVCLACQKRFETSTWQCPDCGYLPVMADSYLSFAPTLAKENDGFTQAYFDQLFELEANHFWFRARNRLIIWAVQTYLPTIQSLLEVGCGTGFVLTGIQTALPDVKLYGSEIFTQGLNFASQRSPGVTLFQMDARQIPFDQEFDGVCAFDVLEHIDDDETVLKQLFQAVKPGGGLILTVPQHQFLWSIVDERAFHKRRYSRQELVEKVKQAGFAIVRTTSFVSLLLPLMLLSRLKRQANQNQYDPLEEYRMNAIAQRSLEFILKIERIAIQMGLSFSTGGSLLLVANKIK